MRPLTCVGASHLFRAVRQIGAISGGDWMVESIVGVDQARNLVYFTGTATSPLERHLYSSSLAPAEQPPPPVQVSFSRLLELLAAALAYSRGALR